VVDEIIKSEKITDEEFEEIEEVNIMKKIGFDGRIFLHWATDDDGPGKGERISLKTLITDGFFRRIKNKGVELSFERLDDVNFEKELLKKVRENGDSLMLVKTRKQFLSEFGDLLFHLDEIIKFKKITDSEIVEMETVKNKQK
jgi:phosphoribosyl-ATP pyrophosphohydrolase